MVNNSFWRNFIFETIQKCEQSYQRENAKNAGKSKFWIQNFVIQIQKCSQSSSLSSLQRMYALERKRIDSERRMGNFAPGTSTRIFLRGEHAYALFRVLGCSCYLRCTLSLNWAQRRCCVKFAFDWIVRPGHLQIIRETDRKRDLN